MPGSGAALSIALAIATIVAAGAPARADIESFRDPQRKAKVVASLPKVEARITEEVAVRKIPGFAFGVVLDGELVYAKGFGVADVDDQRPVDADTVFRIGSITKTFTSLAILKLRDAGKLSLDNPAVRTLPELAALRYPTRDSAPITIRQLLTHTSGLPQFGNHRHARPDRDVTQRELFNDLPHLTLLAAPGAAYSYSTFGMALLGAIVQRVSGMRYRDYVSTQILAPLGMRSTFWDARDVPPGRLATGYVPGAGAPIKDAPWRLGEAEAAGGLYTSLRDLARYAAFQLAAYPPRDDPDQGPVRRSSVREAHAMAHHIALSVRLREPSPEHPALVSGVASGVGLAWHGFETCELEQIVGHMGILGGYSAGIELYPRRGFALVSLSNHRDAPNRDLIWAARDILLASQGLAPRARTASPVLRHALAALVNLYAGYSEAKYKEVFAPLYVGAFAGAELQREAVHLKQVHGQCKDPTPLEIRNDWGGRFSTTCERGRVEYDVQIDADGRLVESRDELARRAPFAGRRPGGDAHSRAHRTLGRRHVRCPVRADLRKAPGATAARQRPSPPQELQGRGAARRRRGRERCSGARLCGRGTGSPVVDGRRARRSRDGYDDQPVAGVEIDGALPRALTSASRRSSSATASAESFRNGDPSGSLSNLRLEIPLSVVALRAA